MPYIWNTGVDDLARPLPLGHLDPHWRLVQGPPGTTSHDVYVLKQQIPTSYFTTSDSLWVWADADGLATPGVHYIFETRFHFLDKEVDFTKNWAEITGRGAQIILEVS